VFASLYAEFEAATAGPDHEVDLFGAAMIVSRLSGREVDVHSYARKLDLVADAAREHAGDLADTDGLAQAIDHELFSVLGFHGAAPNYSDPTNSFLSEVIDRREGIPISLSLVYMEVGQRLGLRCDGIGYPRHFIVRCGDPGSPIYVDPFNQGARLDQQELFAGMRGMNLGGAAPESFLCAVTRRQLLQRVLTNLQVLFRESRDLDRWLAVVELRLRIEPWNAALVGERGMLHYRLGSPALALADLERYVDSGGREAAASGAIRLLNELRSRHGTAEETL
jgi:regulator of sirC expression with transglutaminase-like and TPR domain